MPNRYRAQQAGLDSLSCVSSGRKQDWLDLFADDAVIGARRRVTTRSERPGAPRQASDRGVLGCGDAERHRRLRDPRILPSGDSCANVQTLITRLPDSTARTRCVAVYRMNDAGKVISLRAYWDYRKLEEQMQQLGLAEHCNNERKTA